MLNGEDVHGVRWGRGLEMLILLIVVKFITVDDVKSFPLVTHII